jgi:hypothetical protein
MKFYARSFPLTMIELLTHTCNFSPFHVNSIIELMLPTSQSDFKQLFIAVVGG